MLSPHFDLQVSDDPEVLIYGPKGYQHRKFRCHKIFYTFENIRPNYHECDFALTFDLDQHPRHRRLPLFAHSDLRKLLKRADPDKIVEEKTNFCNFIYSNPANPLRLKFFELLSSYKRVDSGGALANNLGHRVADKRTFLLDYKFTIAFENSSYPGYTTEKITEPMFAESIPIYWGNPLVNQDFNTASFINTHEFTSFKDVVDFIVEVDQNESLYKDMLSRSWLPNGSVPMGLTHQEIGKDLATIIDQIRMAPPLSQTIRPSVSYFFTDFTNYTRALKKRLGLKVN